MIFILYLIVIAFLWWAIIDRKFIWWTKFCGIIVTIGFALILVNVRASGKGWPVQGNLPKRFLFVSAEVVEPNPITKDPGAVYLWVIPEKNTARGWALDYVPKTYEPKAFKFPYSRPLETEVGQARKMQKGGQLVTGVTTSNNRNKGEFRPYLEPRPTLPPKEG